MTDREDLYSRDRSVDVSSMVLTTRSGEIDVWNDDALVSLDIYESLFEPFCTAALSIIDNVGWFEEEPISGDEQLSVTFKSAPTSPNGPMTKTFVVYRVGDYQTVAGSRTRVYTLFMASPIARSDLLTRVRRSFRGLRESEVVSSLLNGPLGASVGEIEQSKYKREFVAAGQKPLSVISYMRDTAVRSSGYPSSNYMFFEDRDQNYSFVTLDLLSERRLDKKVKFHLSRDFEEAQMTRIAGAQDFELVNAFDDFTNSAAGMYGHRMFAHDIVRKKFEKQEYAYRSEFPAQADPDGNSVFIREQFPESLDQRVSLYPWQSGLDYDSAHADDFVLRRASQMRQWENNKINLPMDGTLLLEIGDNFEFELYSNASGVDKLDERNSGRYIATRLHHTIDYKEHRLLAEARKNALKS